MIKNNFIFFLIFIFCSWFSFLHFSFNLSKAYSYSTPIFFKYLSCFFSKNFFFISSYFLSLLYYFLFYIYLFLLHVLFGSSSSDKANGRLFGKNNNDGLFMNVSNSPNNNGGGLFRNNNNSTNFGGLFGNISNNNNGRYFEIIIQEMGFFPILLQIIRAMDYLEILLV